MTGISYRPIIALTKEMSPVMKTFQTEISGFHHEITDFAIHIPDGIVFIMPVALRKEL